jgi:hypothetical protein
MASLSRSARSSGPVVVLVGFTLVFAMAWEYDRPQPRLPLSARRESSDPTELCDIDVAPGRPLVARSPRARRATVMRDGLGSVAAVCESCRRVAAAGIVGGQLCSRVSPAEPARPCFTGSPAFLCGTVEDDEAPRSADLDREDWALE